jgi:hypothetical protein
MRQDVECRRGPREPFKRFAKRGGDVLLAHVFVGEKTPDQHFDDLGLWVTSAAGIARLPGTKLEPVEPDLNVGEAWISRKKPLPGARNER